MSFCSHLRYPCQNRRNLEVRAIYFTNLSPFDMFLTHLSFPVRSTMAGLVLGTAVPWPCRPCAPWPCRATSLPSWPCARFVAVCSIEQGCSRPCCPCGLVSGSSWTWVRVAVTLRCHAVSPAGQVARPLPSPRTAAAVVMEATGSSSPRYKMTLFTCLPLNRIIFTD